MSYENRSQVIYLTFFRVARSAEPTSTSGDYVLLRYIETPQVKSFTLPSLESHEVGEGEPGLKGEAESDN